MKFSFLSAALGLSALFACSSTTVIAPGPGGGADSGPSGSRGPTACGSVTCQAGQYCDDPRFERCVNGCLSDENCASNQSCKKEGSSTAGSCQNTGVVVPPTTTSCTDLCKKAIACGSTVTQSQCEASCAGLTEACKSCAYSKACNAPANACDAECK